jgi:hypothetical protein
MLLGTKINQLSLHNGMINFSLPPFEKAAVYFDVIHIAG